MSLSGHVCVACWSPTTEHTGCGQSCIVCSLLPVTFMQLSTYHKSSISMFCFFSTICSSSHTQSETQKNTRLSEGACFRALKAAMFQGLESGHVSTKTMQVRNPLSARFFTRPAPAKHQWLFSIPLNGCFQFHSLTMSLQPVQQPVSI